MPAKRYTMPENKHEQLAPHRPTEGGFVAGREQLPSVQAKGASRGRGRPKGSTNKPKGLISKELASTILLEMKEMLPPEHFEYMRSVIRDGKAISVEPVFRKDVTERLKVWSALLAQKDKIERAKQDEGSSGKILTIAAGRGIDPGRIRLLVGVEPGSVARDLDSVEQRADEAGTLPDQISERPELLSAGEQDEADRV
jgi:hypothetical protein